VIKAIVLDSGPLARISHPKANVAIVQWLESLLVRGVDVYVPEIADYEVRRELLRARKTAGVARLDELKRVLSYLPITTSVMLRAAALWAAARNQGRPTADPKELDGDVILAAQALEAGAMVVTENIGHLQWFVEASDWRDLNPE
jgi:predicted nucleic acid-binding protein